VIVEQRTYTMLPGRVGDFLHLYESRGMAVQRRILGRMIGYFTSEFGELNQVVHLWGYADLTDRAARRQQLFADTEWLDYFEQVLPLIVRQECAILTPTPFSPIGGADEG
jgi:hypothetical protein